MAVNKTFKIGILTENFILWNGGIDFLKSILSTLSAVKENENIEIFIMFEKDKYYRNYRGIKKLIKKWEYLSDFDKEELDVQTNFEEFGECRFIPYVQTTLNKTVKHFGLDCLILHINEKYLNLSCRKLVYLPDCQHKYYPENFSEKEVAKRDRVFKKFLNSDNQIVVNAESVKTDLKKFYNSACNNVKVMPFAPKIREEFFANNAEIITKYNLPHKYFLISNQFWLQKDHLTAFKAFNELLSDVKYSDVKLICTGLMEDPRNKDYVSNLMGFVNNSRCKDSVICLGFIPKREQIEIMKKAVAIIQPTLFEGGAGGGSVQEAVCLGKACIVSDILCNQDLFNSALEYIYPFKKGDFTDLCCKMKEVLDTEFKSLDSEYLVQRNQKNFEKIGRFLTELVKEEQ